MKKIILSLSVCLAVLLFSNCSNKGNNADKSSNNTTQASNDVVESPDDIVEILDANFKAYLLENFDTNNDGEISISEAQAVKEINCSDKEIENLTGIEKFTNLESLDCSNNKLSELELRYNRKLNKLACRGNNASMFIYIGLSSPLKNENVQRPKDNDLPQDISSATMLLDESKCSYDKEKTNIMVSFDD